MEPWEKYSAPSKGGEPWENYSGGLPPLAQGEQPGMLEAAGRGVEQGALLGFGDELNGGLATALDTLTGKNKSLGILDDYRKNRDESRAAMEAAEQAHPYISGAANLAGALAPALLTGGGSAAAEGGLGAGEAALAAAKTGAKYGAVAGLGNSTADLTQGQVGQAAMDTASGAAGGAILGAGLHQVGQGVGDALKSAGVSGLNAAKGVGQWLGGLKTVADPMEAFSQGLGGRVLSGKQGQQALQKEIVDAYGGLQSALNSEQTVATGAKTNALLDAADQTQDMRPWLKGYNDANKNVFKNEGHDPDVQADLQKVNDYIKRFFLGSEDEGLSGKGVNISPADLDRLRSKLASWSSVGDQSLKTPEARALVTRLLSPLTRDPSITESGMGLGEGFTPIKTMMSGIEAEGGEAPGMIPGDNTIGGLNARISNIQTAKDAMPSMNDFLNQSKTSTAGTNALDSLNSFLETAPADIVDPYKAKLQQLAKAKDIANKINAPGLGASRGIADTAKGGILTAANAAGRTTRAIGNGLTSLYDATPEGLRTLASSVAQSGTEVSQKLSTMLSNAADKDGIGRNALFFAIQQNPEYRKLLTSSTQGQPSTDDE